LKVALFCLFGEHPDTGYLFAVNLSKFWNLLLILC